MIQSSHRFIVVFRGKICLDPVWLVDCLPLFPNSVEMCLTNDSKKKDCAIVEQPRGRLSIPEGVLLDIQSRFDARIRIIYGCLVRCYFANVEKEGMPSTLGMDCS